MFLFPVDAKKREEKSMRLIPKKKHVKIKVMNTRSFYMIKNDEWKHLYYYGNYKYVKLVFKMIDCT